MKTKQLLLTTAVLALLAAMPAAAKADPVTLTLPGVVTVQAGSSVTVIGTIANGGNPSFNISSWTITLGSALLTFDDTGFQGSPFVLNSGDSFGPTGFFDIFADIALTPGSYTGSFTVRDDIRQLPVTKDFRIDVTPAGSTVPEPASMLLLASGLAGAATFIRRRRRGGRNPTPPSS
jgi:opacity protein-like surface antigen